MAKMRPKMARMRPKMSPKMAKMRPKMAKMRPKMAKMRPKRAKIRPKMAKMRPFLRDLCVHTFVLESLRKKKHRYTLAMDFGPMALFGTPPTQNVYF